MAASFDFKYADLALLARPRAVNQAELVYVPNPGW